MKLLIICEKASAARNFAKALGGVSGTFNNHSYVITNLQGHILEMNRPDIAAKPMYRETVGGFSHLGGIPWKHTYFDFDKKKLKSPNYKKMLDNIDAYLKRDYIPVVASDIDAYSEGDLLVMEVLIYLGYNGPILREFHKDETPKGVIAGLSDLKPTGYDDPRYLIGLSRMMCDYMTMQLTRVATVTLHQKGYNIPTPVPFGRLKSVVLTIIGDQEDKVKTYKPTSHFESRYRLGDLVLSHSETQRFETRDEWSAGLLPIKAQVRKVREVTGSTPPPKPLTLSKLVGLANQIYDLPIGKIKDMTQKMYDDGVISYPRSDENFVSIGQFEDSLGIFEHVMLLLDIPTIPFTHKTPRPTHVKESCIHGALHPGANVPSSMEELVDRYGKGADNLYRLIAERYYVMLLEDTQWIKHFYATDTNPEFTGVLKQITYAGAIDDDNDDKDQVVSVLPDLRELATLYAHEVKSQAPAKPTVKWVLDQLIKLNIGTEATRPQTLDAMMGESIKEGKILSLLPIGIVGYRMAKETVIGSVDGTKIMHDLIMSVGEGKRSVSEIVTEFEQLIAKDCEIIKVTDVSDLPYDRKEYATGKFNGQLIKFNSTYSGYRFNDTEINILLSGGDVDFTYTDKKGVERKVTGYLTEKEFTAKGKTVKYFGVECRYGPKEGYAEGTWNGKQIAIKKTFMDHTFTDDELTRLFNGETINIVTTKNGKTYNVSGAIEPQTYSGKSYYGFKPNFGGGDETKQEGYAYGKWNGQDVRFKASFMSYNFTPMDIENLLAGYTIQFTITGNSGDRIIKGSLGEDTWNGRKIVKFIADW